MSIKKLNESEPSDGVSKGLLVVKNIGFRTSDVTNCSGKLHTGYRTTGIKAAGTLYRLMYGTWEYYHYDVRQALPTDGNSRYL